MRYGAFVLPGLMVAGFGLILLTVARRSKIAIAAGLLVVLSGIGRIGTGAFSCDPSGMPVEPSFSHKMHMSFAALTVFSLIAAGFFWSIAAPKMLHSRWFGWYSLISAVVGLLFLLKMRAAIASGGSIGLFQRASVGILNVWLLGLSVMIWRLRTIRSSDQAPPATAPGPALTE